MIVITLPFPDPRLNPNRSKGLHWGATTAIRKKARLDAYHLTRAATPALKHEGNIELIVTFIQPDKRSRDRDNLLSAAKPQLDGVADALGVNDSQFDPVTIKREYGAKPGATRIEIRRPA